MDWIPFLYWASGVLSKLGFEIVMDFTGTTVKDSLITVWNQKSLRKLQGAWIEFFDENHGGDYAVGNFHFDGVVKGYRYEGTRFTKGGERRYSWESDSLKADQAAGKIIYTYTHGEKDEGIGVLVFHYSPTDKTQVFQSGKFTDDTDGNYTRVHMAPFEAVCGPFFKVPTDERGRRAIGSKISDEVARYRQKPTFPQEFNRPSSGPGALTSGRATPAGATLPAAVPQPAIDPPKSSGTS